MFVERGTSFDPIAVADAKRANPEEYFKFCVNGGLRKSLQARFRDGWDQQGVTGTFVFENKVSVSDEAFFWC